MTETGNAPTTQTLFVSAASEIDIERICRERSDEEDPPEVFMVSSEAIAGHLLAIGMEFLEEGQQLRCPGLPLAGAAFDPSWGFSQAEVGTRRDGSIEFRLPSIHPEMLSKGDIYGYRVCILDNHEVPEVVAQLAHIRAELNRCRPELKKHGGFRIAVTRF